MGLDMYLTAKRYLWSFDDKSPDKQLAEQIAALFPELSLVPNKQFGAERSPVKEIVIDAIYWRKANAIHQWFVKNCQEGEDDCGNYYVGREQLEELSKLCKQVLEDRSKASELLPAQCGFFFGSTDYDDWYFEDLTRTVAEILTVLQLPAAWDFEYHSSW